jgi:hypothetical protein
MKKIIILICIISIHYKLVAQDKIILKNGDIKYVKILKDTGSGILYKNYSDIDGNSYFISRSEIFKIKFRDSIEDPKDKKRIYTFSLNLYAGRGFEMYKAFRYQDVIGYIRPGGGTGIGGTFGWDVMRDCNVSISALIEKNKSPVYKDVMVNDFQRFIIRNTYKYKIFIPRNSYINIGAGLGLYSSGMLSTHLLYINKSEGLHFKDVLGYHFEIDYQLLFDNKRWSFDFNFICYLVNFKAKSYFDEYGNIHSLAYVNPIYYNTNGNGLDFCFSLSHHF